MKEFDRSTAISPRVSDEEISLKNNTKFQPSRIKRLQRETRNKHKSLVIWFTGLPGSGKSTLAFALEEALFNKEYQVMALDGDNVRQGLCKDLGFSEKERHENIRRIGEVARLYLDSGFICITAFISPYHQDRQLVRELVSDADFFEVFCDCPLEVCESRDVKGHYAKAREGKISGFTGVSAPYEQPEHPTLVLDTANKSIESCLEELLESVIKHCRL